MSKKHKIKEVKSHMVDGVHTVDLSHNNDKTEWFITIKGEFYTELTFKLYDDAEAMYGLVCKSHNIFMDSLLVATPNNKWVMSDNEISAYEEGT